MYVIDVLSGENVEINNDSIIVILSKISLEQEDCKKTDSAVDGWMKYEGIRNLCELLFQNLK